MTKIRVAMDTECGVDLAPKGGLAMCRDSALRIFLSRLAGVLRRPARRARLADLTPLQRMMAQALRRGGGWTPKWGRKTEKSRLEEGLVERYFPGA